MERVFRIRIREFSRLFFGNFFHHWKEMLLRVINVWKWISIRYCCLSGYPQFLHKVCGIWSAFLVFVVLRGEETVVTLKRLLSIRRDSIACGSGGQGWWGRYPNPHSGTAPVDPCHPQHRGSHDYLRAHKGSRRMSRPSIQDPSVSVLFPRHKGNLT